MNPLYTTGVSTNFNSLIPETYRTDLIKSLLFRCFNLYLDVVKFHHQINILKSILYKNSCPLDFVEKCVKEFLDRVLTQKVVITTVPKKDLMIALPYLGKLSLQICTRINPVMKNKLPHCNFRIAFQTKCKLINFSHSKIKFLFSYVLALLINLSAVTATLLIMAKLSAILKSECVNTLESLVLLERE